MNSHHELRAGQILTVHDELQALAALGSIISKASNLLATVAELYSPEEDRFSGGNGFAAHALSATNALMIDASQALADLRIRFEGHVAHQDQFEAEQQHFAARPPEEAPVFSDSIEPEETTVWQGMEGSGVAVEAAPIANQGFAQSYLELLQRLTDVEVFANEQDMQSVPHAREKLLPLVQGLREELQRLGSVA